VIPSNFRKTRTKDRTVSYRTFFKNLEKKKQRIKLSNLFQNFGIKTAFFKQNYKLRFFFILKKASSYSTRLLRVLLGYYRTFLFQNFNFYDDDFKKLIMIIKRHNSKTKWISLGYSYLRCLPKLG
jgi:hypothetical protein